MEECSKLFADYHMDFKTLDETFHHEVTKTLDRKFSTSVKFTIPALFTMKAWKGAVTEAWAESVRTQKNRRNQAAKDWIGR